MKKNDKKTTFITRMCMTSLTVLLIILFFGIMIMVGRIQGTARVVNYAGLIRGGTQRLIKLENTGQPQDQIIETISSYINGLRNGSDELNFVKLDDAAFQEKMTELDAYFQELKSEIILVREKGYENTDIIEKSEHFFNICDEATGLAEAYSQKLATSLNRLEKIVILDIITLVILIAFELIKALHYAAQNRLLQKKVYLDEATGLPNKNKCEEILNQPLTADNATSTALCVFDLNNLRAINNNLGHDRGDAYIRSFAEQLRIAVPAEYFVGRDGGDEFIAVLTGLDHDSVQDCLNAIRIQCAEYSRQHPELPISYAAGYALSTEFPGSSMRDLFRHADQNMYIDKNRAKMQETAERQKQDLRILHYIKSEGFTFSSCLYCDALQDQYRALRNSAWSFLAADGSYSGALEQIIQELSTKETRKMFREQLQYDTLDQRLRKKGDRIVLPFCQTENGTLLQGRVTVLFCDRTEDDRLHHFIIGFEEIFDSSEEAENERIQLTRYYEQMKQSILENDNYVDAMLETAEAVYTVNLTEDRMEKVFYQDGTNKLKINLQLPCSYDDCCTQHIPYISEETLENYCIVDSSEKLLNRFNIGDKQVTVEYQEKGQNEDMLWLQKIVLMSQEIRYNSTTNSERTVIHGIILFRNTSAFHKKEQQENERLLEAFEEASSASRAKTEFLNRMSHDIRTPINGIMGMLEIIRTHRQDMQKVDDCLDKIQLSTDHLMALVEDVLSMSRIESGKVKNIQKPFDLEQLLKEVSTMVNAQLTATGITHKKHRKNIKHTALIGNPLYLRQIMLNLISNSIKYNKPNGQIDTWVEELSCDETTATYEFKIIDTGIGMSQDFVQNQLFCPFSQEEETDARTKYKGTGLGMSIVKGLLEQLDGSIQVESTPGKGTTISFQLPLLLDTDQQQMIPADKPGNAKLPKESKKTLNGTHILIAEDNEINMEISEFFLTDLGATVEKVWNGQDALTKFQQSDPGTYDAILMDIMMPVMDGLEATHCIRMLNRPDAKKIPIIAMTAQTATDSIVTCRAAGMNAHISKPATKEQLGKILFTLLEKDQK